MYNQLMNFSIFMRTGLKETCRITGVIWAASLVLEQGTWRILNKVNLSPNNVNVLDHFLTDTKFLLWLGNIPVTKHTRSISFSKDNALSISKIYAFPVASQTILLIGTTEILDIQAKRIWKYFAKLGELFLLSPADENIEILQKNILDLELTQQELRARINAQREAEASVIQSAKLAAVGEMAAGVAHELNNPLTTIVGFTELVIEDLPQGSSSRIDLELVLQEAKRARSVVRGLLDFARQSETIRVRADVNEIVEEVLLLTKHLMYTSNVQLEYHLYNNLAWVRVDRNQIKQVVINLINNALYAMPSGGRILIETTEQCRYSQPWIKLSVCDNGIGIPQENLERIFEPFFTTRGDQGGTGLGLSVTYGIITDHGGMIEVESQINIGTTFDVWLPLDSTE